ncbi:hypothetical protein [Acholeplasma laidlawii]|uniref:hypothetical protein n=1 Tax=Acholeplasma laidlawii TaxID=2148 RepID=UPI0021F6CE2E|nr:hypothetical protein [Acholeplasma laidlawii]
MDKNTEEMFVRKFIDKNKRNRAIYELFNSEKRADFIRKIPSILAHDFREVSVKSDDEIHKYLLIDKVMSPIYVISDDEKLDGKFEHPEKAISHALYGGGTYILLFNHAIFIKEEIGFSSPKYIIFIDK